ncbi:molecular chaperone HtpG [Agathobaculum sp.]|jgi:molecular chaperone HtpG|uniref:molecular chaperone HtpG n=1 Tax=Agathobaculum sp. TaxID=2048138 RepID=UPI000E4F5E86|nr:molecular chaperone HtpG [Butyricicoccus sp. AM42-5AC]RHT59227.1 molecular chaperone HtpG [Butyricicoccus sp. AM29-23AC]RHV42936.1 molecular chaperone HtpG [Butyricicoccus sp. OM04-18BH]
MAQKQFKAESKRLLDLMINSIYTHKEIFLRELISNASDATDKLYYNAMKEGKTGITRDALPIELTLDKANRRFIIEDHGCGMTAEELESNLGTIARSGSLAFKAENEKQDDIDIIGQFGVGFYAAFMVAKHVEVVSRAVGSDSANRWESDGADGYTVTPCEKAENGTKIVLTIKDNTESENYDEFLEPYRVQGLVKKYSDYIRYPIKMDMTRSRMKEKPADAGDDYKPEWEEYTENTTLNSMVPIWKKSKKELKDEDYNNFYTQKFFDYQPPLCHIHTSVEGAVTYTAMLFIPSHAPMDYYTKDYEKGLQLYSNGVLIMDKCADLLPDHFSFVRGMVDTADLSLNISREMLQHDRHLKAIAQSLEKKIKSELLKMQKDKPEDYDKFWAAFGRQIKYGAYVQYGAHKELLQDLLMYHSSTENKLVSLKDYVSRMKEDQKYIYYACGETVDKIKMLPVMETLSDKGYEVLCMDDSIDEFCTKMIAKYDDKEFKSILDADLGLESEEEREEIKKQSEDNKELLDALSKALEGKVKKVELTGRLKNHPCCLRAEGPVTLEMEKVLNQQAAVNGGETVRADRVLELNADHPIFKKLCALQAEGSDALADYADILYTQSLLIEGLPVDDPAGYANKICALLAR